MNRITLEYNPRNRTASRIIDIILAMDNVFKVKENEPYSNRASRKTAKEETFERIPGLAYTREERLAELHRGMEDVRAGRVISNEDMEKWINRLR